MKYGGPAFPVMEKFEKFDDDLGKFIESYEPCGGMSLRDYLAAKALIALIPLFNIYDEPNRMVNQAYKIADAMLAERDKTK